MFYVRVIDTRGARPYGSIRETTLLKDKDVWPKVDLETLEEYHKHLMSR